MPTVDDITDLPPDVEDPMKEVESIPVQEAEEMTLQDIFKRVMLEEDIFLIIDAVEELRLRKGLSKIKHDYNAKLRDNNLEPEDANLEFKVHEDTALPKNQVKIQIYLKKKPTITVHKLQVADGEL